jgi:tripartite-type tricarboxylate transporter receptor subunit TctC
MNRVSWSVPLTALFAMSVGAFAYAQDVYPSRPVLLTHGFAAGGNADTIARIVGEPLSARLGQPVVVEPRPGAGGNTASARVAKGTPDGYTLIVLTGGQAVSAAIYRSLPFDPVDDFEMLSTIGFQAFVIAVRKESPIQHLGDLIATAKAAPGKLTFSSVGVGTTQHLAGELLCALAQIQMTHVPYRGGAAPLADVLAGRVDVLVDTITIAEPQLAAGTIRALGVTSPKRWWSLPDISPVADTVPGYDVQTWIGLATTKGTGQPLVQRLNSEIRSVVEIPSVRERLGKIGMDVRASSPEDMRSLVSREIAKWKKVVDEAKIPQQ